MTKLTFEDLEATAASIEDEDELQVKRDITDDPNIYAAFSEAFDEDHDGLKIELEDMALGYWSRGFLVGLAMAKVRAGRDIDGQLSKALGFFGALHDALGQPKEGA